MNKFEIVDETLKQTGVSPQEIVLYWLKNNRISRNFLQQACEVKIDISDDIQPHLQIGWYVFAEGKFSPYPNTFPNPIGLIAWMKPDLNAKAGERGIIILFDMFEGIWSDNVSHFIGLNDSSNGETNTSKIIAYKNEQKVSCPIADFCETIGYQHAFIPAFKQLDKIAISYPIIKNGFKAVGKEFHSYLFSSTEFDDKHVICMDIETAKVIAAPKTLRAYTYPIMLF